ncbi:MAG: CPBP family intramembrane glutamic endopeptidase [Polyangiaceae bacterium]
MTAAATRKQIALGLGLSFAWLALARLVAYYGVLALPRSLASHLTLHSYLSLVLVLVTGCGLLGARLLLDEPREALGATRPSLFGSLAGLLAGPVVLALSAYVAFKVALPTLIAEITAGGKQAAEANTGEFGRALVESQATTTLLWGVLLTPLAEELLFRGVLWTAITRATAPTDSAAASLPAGLITEGFVVKAIRRVVGLLRRGGIATLVTAAIFAAMHADQSGGAGIVRVAQTASLGLALGVARQASGSIFPGMLLHAAFNALTVAKLRRWLAGPSWPLPLPIPVIWWQLAAGAALLLALLAGYAVWRRRATA